MYNIDNRASMAIPRCLTAVVYRRLKRHTRFSKVSTLRINVWRKETINKVDEARIILLSIFFQLIICASFPYVFCATGTFNRVVLDALHPGYQSIFHTQQNGPYRGRRNSEATSPGYIPSLDWRLKYFYQRNLVCRLKTHRGLNLHTRRTPSS